MIKLTYAGSLGNVCSAAASRFMKLNFVLFNSIQHWGVFNCASLPEINHNVVLCIDRVLCMSNGNGFACSSVSLCLSYIIESVRINEVFVKKKCVD